MFHLNNNNMNKQDELAYLHTLQSYGGLADAYQGQMRRLIRQRDRLLATLQDLEDQIRDEAPGFDATWEAWQALYT